MQSYQSILNDILRDIRGQSVMGTGGKPRQVDTSAGSMAFMYASTLAARIWDERNRVAYAIRQVFPDSADTANLEHHAAVRGLSRKVGESDDGLIERVLRDIRDPDAGGKASDYERWAEGFDEVAAAWCYRVPQGPGSVDVVVQANIDVHGAETPSTELLDAIRADIEARYPAGVVYLRILAPVIQPVGVTATVSGDITEIEAETVITDYLSSLGPGESATLDRLKFSLFGAGATTFAITEPTQDIDAAIDMNAGVYTINRPGDVNVVIA